MDERIKEGYRKIYSELFWLVFWLAAGSVVVNVIFFHKDINQLWFEYIILVGSPVYRLVRLRMLEITAVSEVKGKERLGIWLIFGILGAILVFMTAEYIRFGKVELRPVLTFLIPYILVFCLTTCLVNGLQRRWKRKLDKKYEE